MGKYNFALQLKPGLIDVLNSWGNAYYALRETKIKGDKLYELAYSNGTKRFFVADFYCHEKKLVIEIDGKIHEQQAEHEEYRTFIINQLCFKVVRLKNEELRNISQVIDMIRLLLQ